MLPNPVRNTQYGTPVSLCRTMSANISPYCWAFHWPVWFCHTTNGSLYLGIGRSAYAFLRVPLQDSLGLSSSSWTALLLSSRQLCPVVRLRHSEFPRRYERKRVNWGEKSEVTALTGRGNESDLAENSEAQKLKWNRNEIESVYLSLVFCFSPVTTCLVSGFWISNSSCNLHKTFRSLFNFCWPRVTQN